MRALAQNETLVGTAACLFLLPLLALAQPDNVVARPTAIERNGIAAIISSKDKTKVVTKGEVREAVAAQEMILRREVQLNNISQAEFGDRIKKLRQQSLDTLIERELIMSEFEEKGGALRPQYIDEDVRRIIRERFEGDEARFDQELKASGMTRKKFRDLREKMMIVQLMRSQQTKDLPPATPQEKDKFRKENPDVFRESGYVKLRTIMIPKFTGEAGSTAETQRRFAEEIRQGIVKGKSFASQAQRYSKDSVATNGGDRGWIGTEGSPLKQSITQASLALKSGEVSQVLEDATVYWLLYAEEKQLGKAKPEEEAQELLEKLVMQQKRMAAHDRWVAKLRKKAKVTIK